MVHFPPIFENLSFIISFLYFISLSILFCALVDLFIFLISKDVREGGIIEEKFLEDFDQQKNFSTYDIYCLFSFFFFFRLFFPEINFIFVIKQKDFGMIPKIEESFLKILLNIRILIRSLQKTGIQFLRVLFYS